MAGSEKVSVVRFGLGSGLAFVVYVFGHSLAFFSQLGMAHILGANSYGIYAYVLSWMSVLTSISLLGFNVALLRFFPIYIGRREWRLLAGLYRYAERRVVIVSILLSIFGAIAVLMGGHALSSEVTKTFCIGFFLITIAASVQLRCAVIRAYGGVASALLPVRVVREAVVFVTVIWIFLFGSLSDGAPLLMGVTVIGTLGACIIATLSMRHLAPARLRNVRREFRIGEWRKAAGRLFFVTVFDALFDKTGVLVLGWIGNTESAGVYALIFNISLLVVLPRTAINTTFAPKIARLHAEKRYMSAQRLINLAALLSLVTALGIIIVILILAPAVLGWFGLAFEAGVGPLHYLLFGQLFAAAAGPQLQTLCMTGRENTAASILCISTAMQMLVCVIAATMFGLVGAAMSTMVALVAWNILMAYYIWKHLGVRPGLFGLICNFTHSKPDGNTKADAGRTLRAKSSGTS